MLLLFIGEKGYKATYCTLYSAQQYSKAIILLDSILYLIYFSNHSFTHFQNFMVSNLKTTFVSITLFTVVVEMPMCPKLSSENLKSIIWVTRERHCRYIDRAIPIVSIICECSICTLGRKRVLDFVYYTVSRTETYQQDG